MTSNQAPPLEIEVKFPVQNLESVRSSLVTLGAVQKKERVFELNIRFDTPDDSLLARWELLRLRQDAITRLTFKARTDDKTDSDVRILEEYEVEVSDFGTMQSILENLGLVARQTYEKYRETFTFRNVEIVLDELPFGDFVEIEGSRNDIKEAARLLNLDWTERILTNYLALMAMIKEHYSLQFDDLTFQNFENMNISIHDILPLKVT